ncbi:MAG: glycosyltransferase family 1 protein, partial [Lentisphaeria bacterium]|nr:glycosyltransferase family 1 protein [Lentisphaeria bacterium]
LQYLIREGEHGRFCDPEDPGSIAAALELCRRDMAETRRMAERARREAAETYSWTKIAARLAEFYREVKNGFR